nr:response regulator [Herbaspirillum sp. YR522]
MSPPNHEPAPALVLIVENDTQVAHGIAERLRQAGLRTTHAVDGRQALECHLCQRPDLVLLEVSVPRVDGWAVLVEIRRRGDTAVIVLTALTHDLDKLMGLRLGADDYICKPFNPEEVVARCQAVLRRARRQPDHGHQRRLRRGPLLIDLDAHEASVLDNEVQQVLPLTLTEFKLLAHLAQSPQRVCSRAELLDACLPESESMERTMDSHICKLRKKLESAGITGCPLGVRGVGYKLWNRQ